MTRGRRWGRGTGLVLLACVSTVTGGCTASGDAGRVTVATVSRSSALAWESCGDSECALLGVPIVHGDANSPVVALDVVRKMSSQGDGRRVLVLLPDRESGDTARATVERASLRLGPTVDDFTVVALGMRGTSDGALPTGWESATGTLATVEDLEVLRRQMGEGSVSVIGWGSGATVAAAWTMLHPDAIRAAVLDTPADPATSMARQGTERIAALAAGVDAAWQWCASHISCPLNHEPTVSWQAVRHIRDIESGPPELTDDAIARAAYAALSAGQTRNFFVALHDVIDRLDPSALVALARLVGPVTAMIWRCADLTRAASERIVAAAAAIRPRWFVAGDERHLHAVCTSREPLGTPLGSVRPAPAATDARVLVLAARFDPVWAVAGARKMARRMSWTYASVPVTRHLVVGVDRVATARAMKFLTDD